MNQKLLAGILLIVFLAAFAAAIPNPPSAPSASSLPTSNVVIVPTLIVTPATPADNAAKKTGMVQFTATLTNTSPVTSCSLLLNGTSVTSGTPTGTTIVLTRAFTTSQQGNYAWSVSCTGGTLTNSSVSRTINISENAIEEQGVTIALDDDEYLPGETVKITVSEVTPLAGNVTLKIGLLHTKTVSALLTGIISYEYLLPLDAFSGNYTVSVMNEENRTQNGTAKFLVPEPNATLTLSKNPALPGDKVKITGTKFLSAKNVTLTILDDATELSVKNLTTTSAGAFSHYYDIPSLNATNLTITAEMFENPEYYAEIVLTVNALHVVVENKTNESQNQTQNKTTEKDDTKVDEKKEDVSQDTYTNTNTNNNYYYEPTQDDTSKTDDIPDFRDFEDYETEPKKGFSIWWILIPLLFVVLIIGGFVGFVGYEGYLDLSSPDAFIDGCKRALGMDAGSAGGSRSGYQGDNSGATGFSGSTGFSLPGDTHADGSPAGPSGFPASGGQSAAVPEQDFAQLANFINGERGKGYDDLTIRNALLQKGWSEPEVDGVFDRMYENH